MGGTDTRAQEIAGKLTKAQRWALDGVARGMAQYPAGFGQYMMKRPGAMGDRTIPYKAQGYGRMGGTMMWRLWRMKLVEIHHERNGHWCPTRATITPLGLEVRRILMERDHADQ